MDFRVTSTGKWSLTAKACQGQTHTLEQEPNFWIRLSTAVPKNGQQAANQTFHVSPTQGFGVENLGTSSPLL